MTSHNVCTNFYSNYLYKGLALYNSLEKTSKDFCLWILCMDNETYKVLTKLKLKKAKLIKLSEVEDKELLKIKDTRNKSEYSWTLKSSLMRYLLHKYPKMPSIFYLDGDMFFFGDIKKIYEDIGNSSIAIAPHRFPKYLKSGTKTAGVFNAGVVYIKRDVTGLKVLERWRKQCIKWCYWRLEDGKLGDQMYLDEWPKLYNNLHQFQHPGINLAPWNVNEYQISKESKRVTIDGKPLIFYHFHQFLIYSDLSFEDSSGYGLSKEAKDYIYKPYETAILQTIKTINKTDPGLKETFIKKHKLKVGIQRIVRNFYPLYWQLREFTSK